MDGIVIRLQIPWRDVTILQLLFLLFTLFSGSPDEKAIVQGLEKLGGIFFQDRTEDKVILEDQLGEKNSYEILHVFDYSSERKRMSVVAKDPQGRVYLFSKGADSALMPLMTR